MTLKVRVLDLVATALFFLWAGVGFSTVVCPAGTTVQGVDVTSFQGSVNWEQVAASGVEFAFTRAADGLSPDTRFATNYAGIRAAGMIRGAYQVLRPGDDVLDQADVLLARIGTIGPGDLPPALHVEVTDGESPATIGQAVEAWAEAVEEATGRRPFIFTNASFWNSSVSASGASQYPLWIAHWDVTCPNTPALWSAWSLWQYSAGGTVPGIVGLVDQDVFNGSSTELEELAGVQPVPAMGPITRIALVLTLFKLGLMIITLRRRVSPGDT